ncbi:MAG: RNA polymerase sigma factor [Bacteroidota bacterium]
MIHPFSDNYADQDSLNLVKTALNGDKKALDQLIRMHQPFVYNVAWKMTHDPDDAMDLTQEVMIKIVTRLSQFKFKSAFRTWLYRIVVNEFLQTKRRKSELQFTSLEAHGDRLDSLPNPELTAEERISLVELSKEVRTGCMSGMIMCLSREQRLIYILGDVFSLNHNIGAEIFSISPQNFRVKLHRARKDLYSFMNDKCGLVNKENPCRCPKKAKAMKELGLLQEGEMRFNLGKAKVIRDFVDQEYLNLMDVIDRKYLSLFWNHNVKEDPDVDVLISELIENEELNKFWELN